MFCPSCGNEINEDSRFCAYCGNPIDSSAGYGNTNTGYYEEPYNSGSTYNNAGHNNNYNGNAYNNTGYNGSSYGNGYAGQKSRVLAGILQIFFGGFGVGRFYLGYTGIGVGQILSNLLCGIGVVWGFVDGILILCGHVTHDAKGIPLKD